MSSCEDVLIGNNRTATEMGQHFFCWMTIIVVKEGCHPWPLLLFGRYATQEEVGIGRQKTEICSLFPLGEKGILLVG